MKVTIEIKIKDLKAALSSKEDDGVFVDHNGKKAYWEKRGSYIDISDEPITW